jgi:hypothetical protein
MLAAECGSAKIQRVNYSMFLTVIVSNFVMGSDNDIFYGMSGFRLDMLQNSEVNLQR